MSQSYNEYYWTMDPYGHAGACMVFREGDVWTVTTEQGNCPFVSYWGTDKKFDGMNYGTGERLGPSEFYQTLRRDSISSWGKEPDYPYEGEIHFYGVVWDYESHSHHAPPLSERHPAALYFGCAVRHRFTCERYELKLGK